MTPGRRFQAIRSHPRPANGLERGADGYNTGMGGYDTRVDYRGDAYIVQTQDKGRSAQYIESLIYKSGRLLTTKRAFYTASSTSPTPPGGSSG